MQLCQTRAVMLVDTNAKPWDDMSQTLTKRNQEHASEDIPVLSACIGFITPCTLDMNIFEQNFLQTLVRNNTLN